MMVIHEVVPKKANHNTSVYMHVAVNTNGYTGAGHE